MKIRFTATFLLLLLFCSKHVSASTSLETLSIRAVSENSAESAMAISELRALGPSGLEALLTIHADEVKRHVSNPVEPATPAWLRLSAALDAVSQQKDSYLSGLYWYTDLSAAESAARASGKPILSLRLLGKLNEEFSCANSRFFRSVLYANADVSSVLREHYVLHWQSVRPAPKVTVDFGDGRKLERTVTGNSIHYILDSEGNVIDALPGLYGPAAFLRTLGRAEEISRRLSGLALPAWRQALGNYHRAAVQTITAEWLDDATRVGGKIPEALLPKTNAKSTRASDIAPLAMTKAVTEVSLIAAITRDANALTAVTDEATWNRIASLHIADAQLDERSINLIRRQMQGVWPADDTKIKVASLLQKLEQNIALDTVRNEYMMHTKVQAWLASGLVANSVDTFNEKVYAELFLTPRSDPWLGLFAEDTYTGLDHGGIIR